MRDMLAKILGSLAVAALPLTMMAVSTGPPTARIGAPASDGGMDCTACHRPTGSANTDTRGRLMVGAASYTPGVKQNVHVTIEHSTASKWGFQLTARLASDTSKRAGTFTVVPDVIRVRCGLLGGTAPDAPCNGDLEFASHVRASTWTGQTGKGEWHVEWTPPATDVGDIIFFAVGNAADNSNTNAGDSIYSISTRIGPACTLTQAPRITTVKNGASFEEKAIGMNTMLSVGGANFQAAGASREAGRGDIIDGKFPAELGCVAVEIDGRRAPLTYVSANQINVQAPSNTGVGSVPVRVIANPGRTNELRSDVFNVQAASHAPAIFRYLPSTNAAAQFANSAVPAADPALVPGARKPRVGEIITVYLTGLGPTNPVYQAGEIPMAAAPSRDPVTVEFNGTVMSSTDVLYVGVSPQSISGLYQANIRIPTNARPNADNTIVFRIGSLASQPGVVIPVGQ